MGWSLDIQRSHQKVLIAQTPIYEIYAYIAPPKPPQLIGKCKSHAVSGLEEGAYHYQWKLNFIFTWGLPITHAWPTKTWVLPSPSNVLIRLVQQPKGFIYSIAWNVTDSNYSSAHELSISSVINLTLT